MCEAVTFLLLLYRNDQRAEQLWVTEELHVPDSDVEEKGEGREREGTEGREKERRGSGRGMRGMRGKEDKERRAGEERREERE